jgi:catechol 2,3-dioxygenase-like lactoylglutathione lyase family enzyme
LLPRVSPRGGILHQSLAYVAFLVREYDEAISYFVDLLSFRLIEDTRLGAAKRWVVVAPPGTSETGLLLARARGAEQEAAVGRQGGGRVMFFLHTDDFWGDYNRLEAKGVKFVESPREESYGTVVVFEDLYGNRWDLVQHDR